MTASLKLYVWDNPYPVSYGSSLVIAVATNLRNARKEATKGRAHIFGVNLGKPTRIVQLPCAEWYEWSE